MISPPPQGWKRERASWRERGKSIRGFRIGSYSGRLRSASGRSAGIESNHHGSNTARQASLRLVFCRRRQAVIARTLGDFAGAKAIDVGCARPLLFQCGEFGRGRTDRELREQQTERRGEMDAARPSRDSGKPCLHDSIPLGCAGATTAPASRWQVTKRLSAKCDFSHICPCRTGLHVGRRSTLQ